MVCLTGWTHRLVYHDPASGTVGGMSTFTVRCEPSGTGLRVAVKDIIDMVGFPTTAGCRAVERRARPAPQDAACLAGIRAGARIVGRTNLHELALGVTGINPWFGTPVNPIDPGLVPGGSSSGAAVAVATDEADIGLGSDTGGSVRIPAACCGCAGLKTTWGRIALDGVWPLAPSFDTIGPLARDVAGLVAGMRLLDPGFAPGPPAANLRVGRLRVEADPRIDAAIDDALALTGWEVVPVDLPTWTDATAAAALLLVREAWASDGPWATSYPAEIGEDVLRRLHLGRDATAARVVWAEETQRRWKAELTAAWSRVDVVATPTLTIFPPSLADAEALLSSRCTLPVNLAGVPALALPLPAAGSRVPASLQLIGASGADALLLSAGAVIEAATLGR
ncbi:MAG: amidase [Acidimicrobiales bacterium]